MLIAIPASAIAIGSLLALIPAAGFCAIIVRGVRVEDEFLKRNLAGYIDYMQRVRGGLLPRRITRKLQHNELGNRRVASARAVAALDNERLPQPTLAFAKREPAGIISHRR